MSIITISNLIKTTINIMFKAVTTQEGLKTIAKVTKSSCEIIVNLHVNSSPSSEVASNIKKSVTNMNNLFSFLEPTVIIKEFVLGDKDGKRPWDYFFEKATIPKGFSWTFKKVGACIEFVKFLDELKAINISSLSPYEAAKSMCDIGHSGFSIIDHSIGIYKAQRVIRRLKFLRRQHLQGRGQRIRNKIASQYKTLKKSLIAIAFSVGVFVLGIFSLFDISPTGKMIVSLITSTIGVIRFCSEVPA